MRSVTFTSFAYYSYNIISHFFQVHPLLTAFVNIFFGFLVDRMGMGRQQLEIASWSFLIAGLVGGIGRPLLFLLSIPGVWAVYIVDLIETVGFVVGTFIFVRSRMLARAG